MDDDVGAETGTEVFHRCRSCGLFILTQEKLSLHKETCEKRTFIESECEDTENGDHYGQDVESVTFPLAFIRLEKIEGSQVENLGDVDQFPENDSSCNQNQPNPKSRKRQAVALVDNVNEGLPTPAPRRSSLRAMKKLQEIVESTLENNESEWEDSDKEEFEEFYEEKRITRKRKRRKYTGNEISDEQYKFKCDQCPTKFKSEADYFWHMRNIHGAKDKEMLACPFCGRMLNKRLCFQSHLKRHENAEATEVAFDLWNKWPSRANVPKNRGKSSKSAHVIFNCKYCLMPHYTHHSFLSHMTSEHKDKGRYFIYKCPYSCTMEFDSMKQFITHMRNDHTNEYYGKTKKWDVSTKDPKVEGRPKAKCDICNKMLDIYYLNAHKEKLHSKKNIEAKEQAANPENIYKCPYPNCFGRFKITSQLKNHFILHLENNPYACTVPGCGVKCDAQCHLDRHMKLHFGKRLVCKKCGVSYSRIDKLRSHICTFDSSKLRYGPDGLLRSSNATQRVKRFEDNTNGMDEPEERTGPSKDIKKVHSKRVNIAAIIRSDPVFIQACKDSPGFEGLIFTKYGNYGTGPHQKTFKCSKCSTIFFKSNALQIHKARCDETSTKIKSETDFNAKNEKETTPPVKIGCYVCGEPFKNVDLLNTHLLHDHDPNEVFKCDKCEKVFTTERSKKEHFTRYHRCHPYKCPECDTGFTSKDRLTQHIQNHRQNPLRYARVCTLCDKELVNSLSRRRHMFLIHGITEAAPTISKVKKKKKKPVKIRMPVKHKRNRPPKRVNRKRNRQKVKVVTDVEEHDLDDQVLVKIEAEPELHISDDISEHEHMDFAYVEQKIKAESDTLICVKSEVQN